MRDNALFFPYISVPNDQWTIKTLLYWDKLSSIVPLDHIDDPQQFTPFMQDLVREELVHQIFPSHFLHEIPDFEKCFINLIEHRLAKIKKVRSKNATEHPNQAQNWISIHAEKLGAIPEYLIEQGLALRSDYAWYEVDGWVANLFMAYLASCLGSLEEVNAAPVTNQISFSRMFGDMPSYQRKINAAAHHKARDIILHSLLPVPDKGVTLDELLRFKIDHGHLLPRLRRSIETHCSIASTLPNLEDREQLTDDFITNSRDTVAEITDAMRPTWSQISFGSIVPLFGAGFTLQSTPISNQIGYVGAACTLAACAYQALASARGNREGELRKPLAYIAHANRRFLS